jgi:hypothetical protein
MSVSTGNGFDVRIVCTEGIHSFAKLSPFFPQPWRWRVETPYAWLI